MARVGRRDERGVVDRHTDVGPAGDEVVVSGAKRVEKLPGGGSGAVAAFDLEVIDDLDANLGAGVLTVTDVCRAFGEHLSEFYPGGGDAAA